METEVLDEINRQTGTTITDRVAKIVVAEAERYNGWANRETWAAHLHMTNDEGLYDTARELASADDYGESLKEWIEALAQDVFDGPSADFGSGQTSPEVKMMVQEIGSLWRVEWREIHAALREE